MASIRKRGNSYLIVVSMGYDYQGKRIRPVQKTIHPPEGLTPKQTEKWLDEQALLFEIEAKKTPQTLDRNITLAKYIESWLRDTAPTKLSKSTYVRDKQDVKRILPHLGHYKLTELRPDIIKSFHGLMRQEKNTQTGKLLSDTTIEGIHSTLCSILSDAVEAGYILHNPAWRTFKYRVRRKDKFIADEEMVKRLAECLEQESLKYEVYFKLILLTGMRRGECCGLKWGDVNYEDKSIHISRNVVKVSHEPIFTKDPKTAAGDRIVYISNEMCTLLKEYRNECDYLCEEYEHKNLTGDDYLFRQPGGLPMTPTTFTYRFNLILKKYNLPKELTVHSLRHTNASLLISQNVDVRTVASLLGHAQPSTTLDIYSHAFDKNKKEAHEKLRAVLEI